MGASLNLKNLRSDKNRTGKNKTNGLKVSPGSRGKTGPMHSHRRVRGG